MGNESDTDFRIYRESGEIAALGRVFDREVAGLQRLARRLAPRIAGASTTAEDLVQATFLTAIEKAASYEEGRAVGAWLVGILGLHARNAARREGHRSALLAEENPTLEAQGPTPERNALLREWAETVRVTLAGLPDRYRPVLEAVLIEECDPSEAARRLALQPATARQQLHRGLERLRDALPRSFRELTLGTLASFGLGQRTRAMRKNVLKTASARSEVVTSNTHAASLTSLGFGWVTGMAVAVIGILGAWSLWKGPIARDAAPKSRSDWAEARFVAKETLAPPVSGQRQALEVAGVAGAEATAVTTPPALEYVSGRVHVLNTSRPIEGAEILVRKGDEELVVAHTDEEGRFRLEIDVLPGDELPGDGLPDLVITARGFADYVVPRSPDRRRSFLTSESITAMGNELVFLVQLYPSYDVSGRVIDAEGEPVAGAELYALDGLGQLLRERAVGESEYDGHFQLVGVSHYFHRQPRPLPLLAISAEGVGFVRVGEEQLKDHSLGPGAAPPPFEGIELRLTPAIKAEILVLDEDGQPLPGARVQARPIAMEWNSYRTPDEAVPLWIDELPERFAAHFESTSDHEGRARFGVLPIVHSRSFGTVQQGDDPPLPMSRWSFHARIDDASGGEKAQASGEAVLLPRGLLEIFGEEGPNLVLRLAALTD